MSKDNDQAVAVREAAVVPQGAPPPALASMAISVQDVVRQAHLIQQVMREVMRPDEHYGVIPGTSGKQSLLKSGAEKLCFTFGLSPKLDIRTENLPNGHREITVICDLYDRAGNHRGQGVGSASTMESKHRYRGAPGRMCPKCGAMSCKPGKAQYGGGYYCDKRSGGCGANYKGGSAEAKKLDGQPAMRQENQDPADQWNTILKMAKKRALVDATLTATAASDIFAQDLDDLESRIEEDAAPVADPQPARTGGQPATQKQPAAVSGRPKRTDPAAEQQPSGHPAIERARDLYQRVSREDASKAANLFARVSRLYGADKPPEIAADRLDNFGQAIADLDKADGLEDMLATVDQWEAEVAAMDGGDA